MIIKKLGSTGLIILSLSAARCALAIPNAVTNLTALTGTTEGTVGLSWTAPSDGVNNAASYEIRIRPGVAINTSADWDLADTFSSPPAPTAPGTLQTVLIPNLQPGSVFGFAIEGKDSSGNFAPLSNNNVIATAKDRCVQGLYDGEGTVTIAPSSIKAGQPQNVDMTFTTGSHSIQTGGFIDVGIPNSWYPPQNTLPATSGYVNASTGTGVTAVLQLSITNQIVRIAVMSGTLSSGQTIDINYIAQTCDVGTNGKIHVYTQVTACGQETELSASPFIVTVQEGDPQYVSFSAFELPVLVANITPIRLSVRNTCGNEVAASTQVALTIQAALRDANWNFSDDSLANLSLAPDLSAPFKQSNINIPAAASNMIVYYRIDSTANNSFDDIKIQYNQLLPPNNSVSYLASVTPVNTGITNASIDTGTQGTLTSVNFSPDGDNVNDSVNIHASLPAKTNWQVFMSSDNFITIARSFSGYDDKINLTWDGTTDWKPNTFPGIAAPGTYNIRISVAGTIVDNSLSAVLVDDGVTGQLLNNADSSAITGADVSVWGPSSRNTQTDANGNFSVYGLKDGDYRIDFHKNGFSALSLNKTLSGSVLNLGVSKVNKLSVLRVEAQRPNSGQLNEIWGNINAFTPDWSDNNSATVHFSQGRTSQDAGDLWNVTPTTFTDLGFVPGKAFTLHFNLPGLGIDDQAITALNVGEIRPFAINLNREPIIAGKISLPAATPGPLWISVEAQDTSTKNRIYGGVNIQQGDNNGTFVIPGAWNGTFLLKTTVSGFVASTLTVTVANLQDFLGADMTLSQGGKLAGNVTVIGDDSLIGFGGFASAYLSAQPTNGGTGSNTTVLLATSTTQAASAYILRGLADGTYSVYVSMGGDFEVSPPGPKNVTVTNGVGNIDITIQQHTGILQGNLSLPSGLSDYGHVKMDLLPFSDGFSAQAAAAGTLPRAPTIDASGNYTFTHLGTGFYSLRAFHTTTGNFAETSVSVIDGQTKTLPITLNGQTFKISGVVTTNAGAPF